MKMEMYCSCSSGPSWGGSLDRAGTSRPTRYTLAFTHKRKSILSLWLFFFTQNVELSKDQSTNPFHYCFHFHNIFSLSLTKCMFLIGSKSSTPNTTPNLVSFSVSLASGLGNLATYNRTRTSQLLES